MTSTTQAPFDPLMVEVWRQILASVPGEMGAALQRSAYSPNIKERLDYSCALFDANGRLAAQAAHIPVHLGAMPLMLEALHRRIEWRPGDMWLCNDPRVGGTHLPDLTLVAPVFGEALLGFVANRAHHADIGGISPGSMPLSTTIFQEGLVLPPIRLVSDGHVVEEVLSLVCANSRTPGERRGDLAAQIAANATGARRLRQLVKRHGAEFYNSRVDESVRYAAAAVRAAIMELPPGVYQAQDLLDGDGVGACDIPIVVAIEITSDGLARFDFTGTAAQVAGSLNATEAITRSACYYVVRCLVAEEIPTNAGCFEPVTVVAPPGSIVNAQFPAAVAAGNVETSQRIVDVCLAALAKAAPYHIPAASQGTMNNLTIGGYDSVRGRGFAYYETICGGAGGGPGGGGLSAVHCHMTNTRNTPVETLESHYPMRVRGYAIVEGSGGAGAAAGGCGVVRTLELLSDATVSLVAERRAHLPQGTAGGSPGAAGHDSIQFPGGEARAVPGKWSGPCPSGAIIEINTPGGAGWGSKDTVENPAQKTD